MRSILLILTVYSFGFSEYIKNNGVVYDTTTNLYWQDDYSDNQNSIKKSNWSEALIYCKDLELNNYNDWRLPNIVELTSIVDDTKYNPAISEVFDNTQSSRYWSSTTNAFYSNGAWGVYFGNGDQNDNNKSDDVYVRCVRAGE
ncbi:MAG: DUF1566 domain-containing protein [Campylobacterota bacterium]|nr:DUF1566 domain-containing protein [Campylobacterota bacterium]